jgi:hypothetical protein
LLVAASDMCGDGSQRIEGRRNRLKVIMVAA